VQHQVTFIRRDYMFRLKLAIIKSISDAFLVSNALNMTHLRWMWLF